MEKKSFKGFLKRKGIEISVKRYLIDAMSYMALGLFASLLIGTIFETVADKTGFAWLLTAASYAKQAAGPAMAVAIGAALNAPPLVLFSLCAVGVGSNDLGGPLGTLLAVIVAAELGKAVYKETKVDILVTPCVTILSGILISTLIGPGISYVMNKFGELIVKTTELQPFFMGILVSVLVGIALTLPISSAAICCTLDLVGLAGGAATAGCCAQMIGFAVMSFRENRWAGLVAQGLGTSMLQMGNIVRKPVIWLPPTIASAITGPIATCVFKLKIADSMAIASGMGTCGLVGPIGLIAADGFGSAWDWIGLILVCIVLPAALTLAISELFRKLNIIKYGDLKLEL